MKIKKITGQHRRDFKADFECEHCGDVINLAGYDDEHFHTHVIPGMVCRVCNKTSPDNYRPLTTKYKEGEHV